MNALIETLNRFGTSALHFAWPMLWQSSLLIAVLFTIDFALRRRVRAAVRYALWLVLLVKLLLPPSLALPTGVAWWLFPSVPASDPMGCQLCSRLTARPPVTTFGGLDSATTNAVVGGSLGNDCLERRQRRLVGLVAAALATDGRRRETSPAGAGVAKRIV